MTWRYDQSTGELSHDGARVATGYSGSGEGKNNPALEATANVGPIPRGGYTVGAPHDTDSHGPYVLRLTPVDGNDCCGRSGFLVHGDSIRAPGSASHGCIIVSRNIREQIWTSGDTDLEVV